MKFNVNDRVSIRLTIFGRECLRRDHDNLYGDKAHLVPEFVVRENAAGWSMWSLWTLMHTFGPYMVMGGQLPFETEIRLEMKP